VKKNILRIEFPEYALRKRMMKTSAEKDRGDELHSSRRSTAISRLTLYTIYWGPFFLTCKNTFSILKTLESMFLSNSVENIS
jgi:hypothetical protein